MAKICQEATKLLRAQSALEPLLTLGAENRASRN
jgi:hypothetical protein